MHRAIARPIALTVLILLIGGTLVTQAQTNLTSSSDKEPKQDTAKIQSMVEDLFDESESRTLSRVPTMSSNHRLFATDFQEHRARVVVEAASEAATSTLVERIEEAGGRVETTYRSSIQAYLSESTVRELTDTSLVSFVRMPVQAQQQTSSKRSHQATESRGRTESEGLSVIGSRAWNEAGINGERVKVGINDGGFENYDSLLGEDLPPSDKVETRSFAEDADIEADIDHGTAVSEIVHDVAPNASLYLNNSQTLVETQNAIDWMLEQNVDVINSSWGFNTGCLRDGDEGRLGPQIQKAREQGVTWVTAAGNEGNDHWRGEWEDPDDNDQHNFSTIDQNLSFDVELFLAEVDGDQVALASTVVLLSWNGDCDDAREAYELEITSDVLRSPIEGDWGLEPGTPTKIVTGIIGSEDTSLAGREITMNVSIKKTVEDAPDLLDLTILECRECVSRESRHLNAKGSVGVSEPAISPDAVSVGAVHHTPSECGTDCSDGSLLNFSSRGPTGDGRTKPDIAAPTRVSTTAFGEWSQDDDDFGFSGTSPSSPHVAGAAALVTQARPAFSPGEVQQFLEDRAEDVGPPGKDNLFGAGILALGPVPQQREEDPRLTVNPTELDFTATKGEGDPAPETLEIGNDGGGTLNWSAQTTAAWLQLGQTSGSAAANVEVAVEIGDLSAGTHQGRIVITASGAEGSPATVPVELSLQEGEASAALEVNPRELSFEATAGESAPPAQSLQVLNGGEGLLEWQARTTVRWIQLSLAEGFTPSNVEVSVNPGDLSPGTHEGRIIITSQDADNGPIRVDVALELSGDTAQAPMLDVQPDPPNLNFGEQAPDGQASLQTTIGNAGGGTLSWQATVDAEWVAIAPNSGDLSADEEQTAQVTIDTRSLEVGGHTTDWRITAEDGEQSATGTIRVQVVEEEQQTEGQLLALAFEAFRLTEPADWTREIQDGCIAYTNDSDDSSRVRVTQLSGSTRSFDVPAGNQVIVCDRVIHIDMRM